MWTSWKGGTVPRHSGGLTVEIDGMMETLKAFRGLDADLRSETNKDLRAAAGKCAGGLAAQLVQAASSCGVPVAPRVAQSVRVKSDRIPVVSIGGAKKVGSGKRGHAGALVWGSEQGPKSDPNRFAVGPNAAGYWIAPTTNRFADGPALDVYRRAVFDLLQKHGLA